MAVNGVENMEHKDDSSSDSRRYVNFNVQTSEKSSSKSDNKQDTTTTNLDIDDCAQPTPLPNGYANDAVQPDINLLPNQAMPQWCPPVQQSDSTSLATLVSAKQISDSRRTFCLLVLFDLLLVCVLWLIACGTSSSEKFPFFEVLRLQVTKYSVVHSLFDIVMLAALRFCFLELTYAIIRIKNPWAVAVSTAVSDVLLILKIFPIFQNLSSDHNMPTLDVPMEVLLLLTSFILTWIEVWLMDFKVLPFETKLAQRTVRAFMQTSQYNGSMHEGDNINEKTPLLTQSYRGYPASRYTAGTSDQASFYSPRGTPAASECGHAGNATADYDPTQYISPEDIEQVERGKSALNHLWSLYRNKSCWKIEKQLENGSVVYSTEVLGHGRTFRIDAIIDGVSAYTIYQEVVINSENMPAWNTTVEKVKILKRIGEQTAISQEISRPAASGLIKSREFITVRRVDKICDTYISAGIFTDYNVDIPPSGRVRGENGPTGFIIEPYGAYSSKFTWILNTNLKGSIPQYLVNSNLISTMVKFVSSMKAYLDAEC